MGVDPRVVEQAVIHRGVSRGQIRRNRRCYMIPTMQAVTITVSNLERSKLFYEDILGFEPDSYYEPTRWQCYKSEGRAYFGITEDTEYRRVDSRDIINFDVEDLEQFWKKIVMGNSTLNN